MKVMRNKLWYLVGVSLKRKLKSKWFVIANLLVAIVVIGIINIDSIINFFGGDYAGPRTIYVVDNAGGYESFKSFLTQSTATLNSDEEETYEFVLADKSVEELKKGYDEETKKKEFWIVEFNKSDTTVLDAKVISKSYIDTMDYQLIVAAINNTKTMLAIKEYNLTEEQISKLYGQIEIKREIINEDQKSEDEMMATVMTTVFPIVVLPFFVLSIMLFQQIGSEVNDEKTTKAMEVIISSVDPKKHFYAKIIAGNAFILIQTLLLVAFGAIGILIRGNFASLNSTAGGFNLMEMLSELLSSDLLANLAYLIPVLVILLILTFIGYSLLAAVLASMTTNAEDFQHVQSPVMMITMVGYYLAIFGGMFKGAILIKILSYVPFISAVLSPTLVIMGDATIVDLIISSVIMALTNFVIIKYGIKIYRVGILNYSSKDLWKKMAKAVKQK